MAIIKKLEGMPAPRFGKHCYFSEGAAIIGNVEMGDDCTIWFNAVLRGDVHFIKIGNRTNVQDCSCIHTLNGKAPCILGDDVTIGHSVTLHGCEVKDGALVGMGATVLDHAVVGRGAIVAAGALVLSNTVIGDGELWGGVPAKFIKKVDPEQAQALNKTYAGHYVEYSDWYRKTDANPANTQVVTTGEEYRAE
ncbi:MAG: gamma carbonic anhydrase family protein [Bacteroidaceae bacterium]|nr:gamma carbonic anhydrase family protein [Bacteroidaceae bacterium]MDE6159737.1 gamma carbonic anhydrase family protein [Bacteroidaceae bacterium]